MSSIDDAIERLQDLALASTDLTIRAAPDYPVSDAGVLPIAIAHLTSGNGSPMEASTLLLFPTISVDFHFSRLSLKQAYTEIDACAAEYMRRLAGDPILDASVDTIVFPVTFTIQATQWDSIATQMLSFSVPVKVLETPITTST